MSDDSSTRYSLLPCYAIILLPPIASLKLQLREYPERMRLGVKNVLGKIDSVVWVLDKVEILECFR